MGNESRSSPESQESDCRFLGKGEWNLILSPYLNRRKNFQKRTKNLPFCKKFSAVLFFTKANQLASKGGSLIPFALYFGCLIEPPWLHGSKPVSPRNRALGERNDGRGAPATAPQKAAGTLPSSPTEIAAGV